MDQILQMILEIVREQQRDAADLKDTMTRAEVVDLTMSMMAQQGVDEYHEDLEADIYKRIQYLAPRLFLHEEEQPEPEIYMEKFSYRMKPTEEALLNNENLHLDEMVREELQGLDIPISIDTMNLDYEQAYTSEGPISSLLNKTVQETLDNTKREPDQNTKPKTGQEKKRKTEENAKQDRIQAKEEKENSPMPSISQNFADDSLSIDEETLNRLVMAKYMELSNSGMDNLQVDSESLASLVMQALQAPLMAAEENISAAPPVQDNTTAAAKEDNKDEEEIENLLKEIWEGEKTETKESALQETPSAAHSIPDIPIARSISDIPAAHDIPNISAAHRIFDIPAASIAGFQNTKAYMRSFEDYLQSFQENQPVLTGFSSIDRILETGLHSGLYLIESDCIDITSFQLQLADQIAMSGIPVCYFLFHHSRYEYMAKSLSRLTYELKGKEGAIPLSSLYKNQKNKNLSSLSEELQYYEKNIASHLYFIEDKIQNTKNNIDANSLFLDIKYCLQTFEQNLGRKPIILLDSLPLALADEEFISNLETLCFDFDFTLITSISSPISNITFNTDSKITLNTVSNTVLSSMLNTDNPSFSSFCIELADLFEQDSFTKREILLENGNSLLLDISFTDGMTNQQKRCQLFSIPKFYCFKSR